MDMIDRQAAIDALERRKDKSAKGDIGGFYNRIIQKDIDTIKQLPSAEPQERTGRWIAVDSYSAYGGSRYLWELHGNPIAFHYCSNCKEQAYCDDDGDELLSNYCPDCGAKMEVDNEV